MCNHHDIDGFSSDLKVEIASKAYRSKILKLIPDNTVLEQDFSDSFTKFRNSHDLTDGEHKQSILNAVKTLTAKGYVTSEKEGDIYKVKITEAGRAARKSIFTKVFSVFSS
jgi:CTP-dependent riboflavin kinase